MNKAKNKVVKALVQETEKAYKSDFVQFMDSREQEQTITTLEVAEMLGMEHKLILRKLEGRESKGKHIKGYVEILAENQMVPSDYFIKSTYKDSTGRNLPCYDVTKMGCEFMITNLYVQHDMYMAQTERSAS